jgi:hypothetical protein
MEISSRGLLTLLIVGIFFGWLFRYAAKHIEECRIVDRLYLQMAVAGNTGPRTHTLNGFEVPNGDCW